jgi:uncharacterized RmlC-like cupin family protein
VVTAPVVLCPGGQLPAALAGRWGAAALAEVTHAPTGRSGLGGGPATLAAGSTGAPQQYAGDGALVVVLAGRLAIDWAAGFARHVVAGPGDAIAVAGGTVHRERHAGGGEVRFVRLAPDGGPVPA